MLLKETRDDYDRIRVHRDQRQSTRDLLRLDEARRNAFRPDWSAYTPPIPKHPGRHVLKELDLDILRGYIDWTPFFQTWQLSGKYPDILQDAVVGEEASRLFADAQLLLDQIIHERWLTAHAVLGIFPVSRTESDDLLVTADGQQTVVHFLRQQVKKADGIPNYSLVDFIPPVSKGKPDHVGFFAVTAGLGIEPHVQRFELDHDDYHAILLKSLADRLAEAGAEWLHEQVRSHYWGYEAGRTWTNTELIAEAYQGIRPAPGYPACPEHSEKQTIWQLLDVESATGARLTENFAMYPAASVSGYYFSHPESRYFPISRIGEDQMEEYARRKGWNKDTARRWLAPLLS